MDVVQIQGGKKQEKVNNRTNEYTLGSRKSASFFSFSFSFSANVYFWAWGGKGGGERGEEGERIFSLGD